jgi:3-oxoacyl-[acyl-carrier protein] reductase
MNLSIQHQLFIVGGATSGLGKAIAEALIQEGAHIIAVARNTEQLFQLQSSAPTQVTVLAGDLSNPELIQSLIELVGNRTLHGLSLIHI